MCPAALDKFFFFIEQIVINESLLDLVADEGLNNLLEEF
jgi:hypothetical protein